MGDPLLLARAEPVTEFDTPELHALLQDMDDTMRSKEGAGIAAPQIGVSLQVVIFGVGINAVNVTAKAAIDLGGKVERRRVHVELEAQQAVHDSFDFCMQASIKAEWWYLGPCIALQDAQDFEGID